MVTEETRSMLEELADLLDSLPSDRFDYTSWVGEDWEGAPDLSCNTTACAAGWAATLPSYQAKGLFLSRARFGLPGVPAKRPVDEWSDGNVYGVSAMAQVLGINDNEAILLFIPDHFDPVSELHSPDGDATAADVAVHIRNWLDWAENGGQESDDAEELE